MDPPDGQNPVLDSMYVCMYVCGFISRNPYSLSSHKKERCRQKRKVPDPNAEVGELRSGGIPQFNPWIVYSSMAKERKCDPPAGPWQGAGYGNEVSYRCCKWRTSQSEAYRKSTGTTRHADRNGTQIAQWNQLENPRNQNATIFTQENREIKMHRNNSVLQ